MLYRVFFSVAFFGVLCSTATGFVHASGHGGDVVKAAHFLTMLPTIVFLVLGLVFYSLTKVSWSWLAVACLALILFTIGGPVVGRALESSPQYRHIHCTVCGAACVTLAVFVLKLMIWWK